MVLRPGTAVLRQIEPLCRQISVLGDGTHAGSEAVRSIELFARAGGIALPVFLGPDHNARVAHSAPTPINGRLTEATVIGHIGRAIQLLRTDMVQAWTVARLAHTVSISG